MYSLLQGRFSGDGSLVYAVGATLAVPVNRQPNSVRNPNKEQQRIIFALYSWAYFLK